MKISIEIIPHTTHATFTAVIKYENFEPRVGTSRGNHAIHCTTSPLDASGYGVRKKYILVSKWGGAFFQSLHHHNITLSVITHFWSSFLCSIMSWMICDFYQKMSYLILQPLLKNIFYCYNWSYFCWRQIFFFSFL